MSLYKSSIEDTLKPKGELEFCPPLLKLRIIRATISIDSERLTEQERLRAYHSHLEEIEEGIGTSPELHNAISNYLTRILNI